MRLIIFILPLCQPPSFDLLGRIYHYHIRHSLRWNVVTLNHQIYISHATQFSILYHFIYIIMISLIHYSHLSGLYLDLDNYFFIFSPINDVYISSPELIALVSYLAAQQCLPGTTVWRHVYQHSNVFPELLLFGVISTSTTLTP